MEAHFVTFYSPGTLIVETTEEPIGSWDVDEAKRRAHTIRERHGATPYAFQFTTRSRRDTDLDSTECARSPYYFLGGTVETLAQVKARATEADRILVNNMEGNGYARVITNTNSYRWVQPLRADDVVLEWP